MKNDSYIESDTVAILISVAEKFAKVRAVREEAFKKAAEALWASDHKTYCGFWPFRKRTPQCDPKPPDWSELGSGYIPARLAKIHSLFDMLETEMQVLRAMTPSDAETRLLHLLEMAKAKGLSRIFLSLEDYNLIFR